jgi:thiamine-monophosphate kinase
VEVAAAMSELDFIDWIRGQVPPSPRVPVGIGDDAAIVAWPGGPPLVVKTDMLLEGSCFVREGTDPKLIGRKALAVNLSDIAAMAASPVAAVISVGLPRTATPAFSQDLFLGVKQLADEFAVALVGGDTNSWDGPLVINIALIGEPTGSGPVLRRGAQPGDWLFVTGPLGGSIRGHHLSFTPRVKEAQELHRRVKLKAMMDISDGLALDLHRLCKESGCGARLLAEQIPISEDAKLMQDDRSPLEHALGDGEDFELLFAVSAEDGKLLLKEPRIPATLAHIGEITPGDVSLRHGPSREEPLAPSGYLHSFGD